MDVFPAQEAYDIGSTVTFNCTVHPTPSLNEDIDLHGAILYQWSSAYGPVYLWWTTTTTTSTITIPLRYPPSGSYYCQPSINGRILGTQRITLSIKGSTVVHLMHGAHYEQTSVVHVIPFVLMAYRYTSQEQEYH